MAVNNNLGNWTHALERRLQAAFQCTNGDMNSYNHKKETPMNSRTFKTATCIAALVLFCASTVFGQMGRTWPTENKIVPDQVTGLPLEFLTSTDGGYTKSKIYQTHRQWTADGKWLIFRGAREAGSQAFAVNEESGLIVQVTENGFTGMLCAGNKTMKLYVMSGGGGG